MLHGKLLYWLLLPKYYLGTINPHFILKDSSARALGRRGRILCSYLKVGYNCTLVASWSIRDTSTYVRP